MNKVTRYRKQLIASALQTEAVKQNASGLSSKRQRVAMKKALELLDSAAKNYASASGVRPMKAGVNRLLNLE
jgi:hypothetical protein